MKITDFGIARLDSSNLTQEGQLLGTPNYMAPEQIQGKEVDHRADLFSLGVVLYEMLTRHKPFQGENLTVVSHRIVYDHFTPPREYARDLPPGVDRILARALEKDPARRYQRAKEMVEDLRQVVEATAPPASTPSTRPRASRRPWCCRRSPAPLVPPPPVPAAAPAAPAARGSFLDRLRGRSATPPRAVSHRRNRRPTYWHGHRHRHGDRDSTVTPAPALAAPPPAPSSGPRWDGRRSRGHRGDRGAGPEAPSPDLAAPSAGGGRVRAGVSRSSGRRRCCGWGGRCPPVRSATPRRTATGSGSSRCSAAGKQARAGNWTGAADLFYQAERLAPNAKKIRAMRVAAQLNAGQQFSQQSGRASLVAMGLDGANKALAAQSYDNA